MKAEPPGGKPAGRRKRRRLLRRARNWLAGTIGPPIVRAWARSLRFRWLGKDIRVENGLPTNAPNGIYVFWHQRMLALAGIFRNSGFRVIISEHGDGEMIARIIARLGMLPVRGSATRGGARAVLQLLREEKDSVRIAITPDGPQGPRHFFHEGAVYLASRTGLAIHPIAIAFKRYRELPTWDGFILPVPFSPALVHVGEPISIPAGLDREGMEAERKRVEEALRALTESTDREFDGLWARAMKLPRDEGRHGVDPPLASPAGPSYNPSTGTPQDRAEE
jgi:lysophospholipid acyltransferase (LPLAT)-like uncharacterized protein